LTARRGENPQPNPVIEKQFQSLVHAATDAILGVDHRGKITIWNRAATKMFGYTAKDAIGRSLHDLLVPGHMLAKAKKGFDRFEKTGKGPLVGKHTECIAMHRDGSEFPVELSVSGFREDGHWQATGIIRDISKRKQMEYALQMREKQLNATLQSIGDAVISTDIQGLVVLMNPVAEKLTGWKGNEASGRPLEEVFHIINEESRNPVENPVSRVLREGIVIGLANHTLLIARDGSEIPIADSGAPIHDVQGHISGVVLVFRDQTAERKAQAALESSNRALRTLSRCNQILIRAKDEAQFLCDICRAIVAEGGYRIAWIGCAEHDKDKRVRPIAEAGFDEGYLKSLNMTWGDEKRDHGPAGSAIRTLKPRIVQNIQDNPRFSSWRQGALRHGYKSAAALPITINDETFGVLNVYSSEPYVFNEDEVNLLMELVGDIAFGILRLRMRARRIQVEEALQKSELRYHEIIKTARDAFVSMDANGIITDWNPQAENIFGWSREEALGLLIAETIIPEEFREAHVNGLKHYIATGEGSVLNKHVEISALHRDGHTFPAELSIVPSKTNGGISFNAFIRNISARDEAQEALKQSREQLRQSLIGTIVAISKAVGARDPYTAQHQQQVSQLSRSIAQAMGLDAERIDGLRMGASIHDIGKIYLPAEILSNPGKLTDIEYQLIKTHAQVGYDILKDVAFPWPVADIAHQHHERLDGSGYPQGLKGDEICLEARIVAVADVVEAMASHRPYRPGLGIEAALEEIETHRGTWFEPAAVDACVKLFREKEFSFE